MKVNFLERRPSHRSNIHRPLLALWFAFTLIATPNAEAQNCALAEISDKPANHPACLFYTGTEAFRARNFEVARDNWLQLLNLQDLPADLEFLKTHALNNLGYLNYLGLGGSTDRPLAFSLWHRAVQRGHEEAAYHLCHAQAEPKEPEYDAAGALPMCREALRRYSELANPDRSDNEVIEQIKTYINRLQKK